MAAFVIESIMNKWRTLPSTQVDLRGRVVVVTGTNVGLGLEAAKAFYKMNPARLIMTSRNIEKGEAAKKQVLDTIGQEGASNTQVDLWHLDLSNFDSVKAFAAKCDNELDRLDVFLSSAAFISQGWKETEDGWEEGLQVNVISNFLLCSLLVPLISKTAKLAAPNGVAFRPHLVLVTSDSHEFVKLSKLSLPHIFQTLNDKEKYYGVESYPVSKMLDLLLTRQLAKSPAVDPGVVVCSVNPGACKTQLLRAYPSIMQMIFFALMGRTAEEGVKTYLWACLTDDIPPGSYTSSCTVTRPRSFAPTDQGLEVQKKAWNELGEIIIKLAPETRPVWEAP